MQSTANRYRLSPASSVGVSIATPGRPASQNSTTTRPRKTISGSSYFIQGVAPRASEGRDDMETHEATRT